MLARCRNPKLPCAHNYALRGINVCAEWANFAAFLRDMGECPDGMSIDRKDNNKGYYPDNCRWATREEQNRNTRRTLKFTFGGVEKCLKDWAKETGVAYETVRSRLKRGIPAAEAIGIHAQ